MPVDLQKRKFNVDEYYRMYELGLFEGERIELVNGEIINMAPIGSEHAAAVSRLNETFVQRGRDRHIVRTQLPIPLSANTELEPDIAVVRFRSDFYSQAHPSPRDTLLVVEVSLSTLRYDQEVKMPLYASAGIPEAWIVDLSAGRVLVHSLAGEAGYGRVIAKNRGDLLDEGFAEQLKLTVDDILP